MLFSRTSEWKGFLSATDEKTLNEFLEKIADYRPAYKNAENVKNAQIWTAMLELLKQNKKLQERTRRLEFVLEGLTSRYNKEREALVDSLNTF
ncbi:hypothetical protein CL614_05350 [archaeon]|nr:hypothetical protein [archaeon]|tara:strand:+ start:1902 stop:2180 length:279 start_codon:yes stop_codon:yes gene_type:complete